jgi:hypothetical protein
MITHAGTGLFCLARFINLFFREVFFLAAMLQNVEYLRLFLSVSSGYGCEIVVGARMTARGILLGRNE